MLKDAALLQLDLMLAALDYDLTLKDATPYNVQFRGAQPVFIDVGSFERLTPGEPWLGYRQFCMLFLYPLLLQAYKGLPFQPWLRGSLEGITPHHCRSLMSLSDLFRRGVFTHVYLHERLERRRTETARDVKRQLRAAGFGKELIVANVRRLVKLVRRLEWKPAESAWSGYEPTTSYGEDDAARKEAFVRQAVGSRSWDLVWDLGCNVGRFARIAAEHARYIVALDADAAEVKDAAALLDVSVVAVNSALQRARTTLRERLGERTDWSRAAVTSDAERELLRRHRLLHVDAA
jgi:hypothetical protein